MKEQTMALSGRATGQTEVERHAPHDYDQCSSECGPPARGVKRLVRSSVYTRMGGSRP